MVTGGSGAVGTEVALKLVQAGVSRLVLFVRDDDKVSKSIDEAAEQTGTKVSIQELDLREPQKVVQKFGNSLKNQLEGQLDHLFMCHGVVA